MSSSSCREKGPSAIYSGERYPPTTKQRLKLESICLSVEPLHMGFHFKSMLILLTPSSALGFLKAVIWQKKIVLKYQWVVLCKKIADANLMLLPTSLSLASPPHQLSGRVSDEQGTERIHLITGDTTNIYQDQS